MNIQSIQINIDLFTINKEESNAIKGLLIFLIVLGHNSIFTNFIPGSFHYLYSFHVACFFILPFFYPLKILTKDRILNYAARMYCPYILLFLLFLILFTFLEKNGISLKSNINSFENKNLFDFFFTLINGGIYHIQKYIGFQYLWFLPVMFSFAIIKEYFYYLNPRNKFLLLFLGMIFFIIFYVFMYSSPYSHHYNVCLEIFSLFSIFQALGFIFLGFITRKIISFNFKYYIEIVFISYLVLSLLFWNNPTVYMQWIVRCFMPTIIFSLLYSIKNKLAKIKFLCNIGSLSLPIYLVQTPISFIFCKFYQFFFQRYNIILVFTSQLLIFSSSYILGLLFFNLSYIRRFFFPRTYKDLLFK